MKASRRRNLALPRHQETTDGTKRGSLLSKSDAGPLQFGKDIPMYFPAVKDRIRIPAKVCRCGGRQLVFEQTRITGAADDDARLSVPRQQHAQPPGVEMKAIGLWQSGKGMPDEHHLELQSLELVRRFDFQGFKAALPTVERYAN